jgi:hypothetical protein
MRPQLQIKVLDAIYKQNFEWGLHFGITCIKGSDEISKIYLSWNSQFFRIRHLVDTESSNLLNIYCRANKKSVSQSSLAMPRIHVNICILLSCIVNTYVLWTNARINGEVQNWIPACGMPKERVC